jgi:hypothetical protein
VRLAPTADEELFARTVRGLLQRRCTPRDVRAGFARGRWTELAEIGVTGLLVPEEHGGLGLGAGALVAVAEEVGRACAPEPVVEAAVAAMLLARVDPRTRTSSWSPTAARCTGGRPPRRAYAQRQGWTLRAASLMSICR